MTKLWKCNPKGNVRIPLEAVKSMKVASVHKELMVRIVTSACLVSGPLPALAVWIVGAQ